jgi:BlaI family transcriptional regulator, penicillinase repressor
MQLSKTEEQLMEYIWKQDKAYLKDIVDSFPDPKPAQTTVATLLKRMQDKGFVSYETHGNTRQYYALVKKEDYFSKHVNGIIENFFDNSALQFASFFTANTRLTTKQLEELRKIIDQEIKKKKK